MSKEPESKFRFYLCELFGKPPSDPFFEEMDPFEKLWLYHGWLEKQKTQLEAMKDQAILIGSFSNLEMAKDMAKPPDFVSTDDEWEESWNYVQSQPLQNSDALDGINNEGVRNTRRRRRKVVNG